MDSLEKYIKENREKLDRYEPSQGVWERIDSPKSSIRAKLIYSIAAAAVLIFVIGAALFLYSSDNRKERLSGIPAEVREMELFYNSMVNTLYLQARPMLTGHPEVEKELENDLARIDEICVEIKNDLKDNVSNQEVIEALIRNYTIKVHILEDMLRILKENENNTEKPNPNAL